jgi:hypothetical protein
VPRPSIVVTSSPSCITARVRQDRTRRPFTITVQAPHCPWSQPFLDPVSCRCSRNASRSETRGSRVRSGGSAVDLQADRHDRGRNGRDPGAAGCGAGALGGARPGQAGDRAKAGSPRHRGAAGDLNGFVVFGHRRLLFSASGLFCHGSLPATFEEPFGSE